MMNLEVLFNAAFGSLAVALAFWAAYSPLIRHFREQQKGVAVKRLSEILQNLSANLDVKDIINRAENRSVVFTTNPDLASMARVQRSTLMGVLLVTCLLLVCVFILSLGIMLGWRQEEIDRFASLLTLIAIIPNVFTTMACTYFMIKLDLLDVIKDVAQTEKISELLRTHRGLGETKQVLSGRSTKSGYKKQKGKRS